MKVLRIRPSPDVGKWLQRVEDAALEGKIKTREEALAYLRQKRL
jgi:hypothetical protein